MYFFLMILTILSASGLQGWRTLINNFAVETVQMNGQQMGVVQSIREIPGFLSLLVIYLLLISGFGVWLSRFQTDSRAYFLGNRNIPWPAVCLSVVATETSVLTFIGIPALSYATDM